MEVVMFVSRNFNQRRRNVWTYWSIFVCCGCLLACRIWLWSSSGKKSKLIDIFILHHYLSSNRKDVSMRQMKIYISDIQYDLDGHIAPTQELPTELSIDVPHGTPDEKIEEIASDFISNKTGFCHTGFCWKISEITWHFHHPSLSFIYWTNVGSLSEKLNNGQELSRSDI